MEAAECQICKEHSTDFSVNLDELYDFGEVVGIDIKKLISLCRNCFMKIKKIKEFKYNLQKSDEGLFPYLNTNSSHINLKKIFANESVNNDKKEVCRICKQLLLKSKLQSLMAVVKAYSLTDILGRYFPEISVLIDDMFICRLCFNSLEEFKNFMFSLRYSCDNTLIMKPTDEKISKSIIPPINSGLDIKTENLDVKPEIKMESSGNEDEEYVKSLLKYDEFKTEEYFEDASQMALKSEEVEILDDQDIKGLYMGSAIYGQQNKWCFVPGCRSTTASTPHKIFVTVPQTFERKKKWFKAARRDVAKSKSVFFCCEDHFDFEQDMENYMRYRLMGGNIFLKKNVVPHKFDCQKNFKRFPNDRKLLLPNKKDKKRLVEEVLSKQQRSQKWEKSENFVKEEINDMSENRGIYVQINSGMEIFIPKINRT